MKGITFGGLHSYNDLNLVLSSKEIGSPAVKTVKIDIEGADGDLDMTDFFGEPKYENVRHKFRFSTIVPQSEFLTLFSTVKNAIHGKRQRIILDDDPSFYYTGRCHVSSFTSEKGTGTVSVECDCEPWRYKLNPTVITATVVDSATVTLPNTKKRVVPEVNIQTDTSIRVVFDTYNIWDLGPGIYKLPELELAEGENTVELTGTGTVIFTYQEAGV